MHKKQHGFTLFELMIVVVIVGLLAGIGYPMYSGFIQRARVAEAIGDLGEIHIAIQTYLLTENRGMPGTLAELGLDDLTDPWGNPYQYLVIEGLADNSGVRKRRNLHPVNSQYDIYSVGRDGNTSAPLTSSSSADDVVMALDGMFFGTGETFVKKDK